MSAQEKSKARRGSKTYEAAAIDAYLRKEITASDLQASLGVARGYMYRLVKRYEAHGVDGLQSRKLGNRNHAHSTAFRKKVIALVREHFADFGPQFASEKLQELHRVRVGAETLRSWMIEEGLWDTRQKKEPKIFQLREPRPQRGELVQVDGSYHRWFEKRGPEACLIVFIDDATSELMELKFVEHESSYNYMHVLKRYIDRYGRPRALYSDRHSIFRATNATSTGQRTPTQFATACRRLHIEIICAETPQAKGRVERANRTLQDRLVKEMRLRGISTLDDANAYAEIYRRDHNARFARLPADPEDAHLAKGNLDLDQLLTYAVQRKVFNDLSISFNKLKLILEENDLSRRAKGQRVDVVVYLDGTIEVLFGENPLPFRVFDKLRRIEGVPEIAGSKRLGAALAFAKSVQGVEPHQYKRNAHVLAGFRKLFEDPNDPRSRALREAPAHIRRKHHGRPRAPLGRHPIVVLQKSVETLTDQFERDETQTDQPGPGRKSRTRDGS